MELVYGPVRSLRYGNTLGINLLGNEKICSYNCAYCSLGPTVLTMNKMRKEYVYPSLEDIRHAFREYIKRSVPTDAIVVSGHGEPTLYPEFEEAMKLVLQLRDDHLPGKQVVVLTNGAHLDSKKVVAGLNLVDQRVVKLDAGNDQLMMKVNDPLIRMTLPKFLAGLPKLKDFVVQSLFFTGALDNSLPEMVEEWIEVVGMIKPAGVQLCTLTRPSLTNKELRPVDEDTLYSIAFKLKKRTQLEATVYVPPKAS